VSSASDLFGAFDLADEDGRQYLRALGFRNPDAARRHARRMADDPAVREALGRLADQLLEELSRAPDPDAALVGFSRYLDARDDRDAFLSCLRAEPQTLHVLAQILGSSSFLGEMLVRRPEYLEWLLLQIDRAQPGLLESDPELASRAPDAAPPLDALKRFNGRHVLRIATLDILGRATLQETTAQLSALADLVISRTLDIVARERLAAEGRECLPGGFAVIGMGKLGGEELNYSSDIDLIYVYEPDDEEASDAHDFFQRLARRLTAALADHTAEGYLYRVDLRLRPMGRSGNIVYSLQQHREYYATWGVTFERFALIKARPVAGDQALGRRFVETVEPFVYRRYLDHAAVEEMYQHKLARDRTIPRSEGDRNVKLGRGGIREVELFVQVLQLTYGARQRELKQRGTLPALDALRDTGFLTDETREALVSAYVFLRKVEHSLQIVLGHQTHTLSAGDELLTTARRLRFETAEALQAELDAHRARVHDAYADLFGRRRGAATFEARQFFRMLSEELPEDEVRADLAAVGFRDPAAALGAIRDFAKQAVYTSAPTTARNLVANLLAVCAPRIVASGRPETLLVRLEQLTEKTGGALLLGRSLLENETLRTMLIDVLDSGELLAEGLTRDPELLDVLVQPVHTIERLRRSFDLRLTAIERFDLEGRLNALRRFKRHEEFKILVGWLVTRSLDSLQERLTILADYCISRSARWLAPVPLEDRGASWAVVALGRLGGMELTVHSDLDLVIVYEDERDLPDSSLRWERFVERLQAFLGEATNEGTAYHIDTRLRPEGSKGPLAMPVAGLLRYFGDRAEPWERLAWTRAQILVGSPGLSSTIMSGVEAFVYAPWERQIPQYMHRIRIRRERELAEKGRSRLDFKVGRGGLADIDFLIELVQIREGRTRPEFRVPGSRRLLLALPPTSYITPTEGRELREAHEFLRTVELFARMDLNLRVNSIEANAAALEPLGKRMSLPEPSGERLLSLYREATERVRSIYTAVLARLADRV
jgi:glutamate-ammonia-ligase adenylyltransferase